MFKNKIYCGEGKPVTVDAVITSQAQPGCVLLLQNDTTSYFADTAAAKNALVVVVKEEPSTAALLATAQNVPAIDVVFPDGYVTQVHELEAGQYYNIRVNAGQEITKGFKYAVGSDCSAVDGPEDAETPIFFLIADENSAAGVRRLVRFKVAFG